MNYPDPNIAAALAAHYGSVARSAQPSRLGLSRRELERYSLARAILASSRGRLAAEAGFEREVSLAEAKARGIAEPLGAGSFYVPDEVLVGKRHMSSQQYDGELVGTDVAPRGIVGETLRSMSVVGRLGVRVEENMTGNLTIPVVTVPPTATWLSEEGVSQITETQPTFTSRPATPKTVAALTKLSHQLLKAAPDLAERLALRELQSAIAEAVDAGVLDGSGHSGEMQGIVNGSLVGSVVGASLDMAKCLEFQADVLGSNALATLQAFGYVTTPTVAKLMAGRQTFSGASTTLWSGQLADGTVCGARAIATNSAPASTIVAGDWSQGIIFTWPGLLLAADPYTDFGTGVVSLRAMLSVDFVMLRPGAFSVASSVS